MAEDAQLDYLAALSRQATLNIDDYLNEMETKNRQFNNSAWGMEFFSTPKLRDAARTLATELYERQMMLRNYNGTSAQFQAITDRVETNGRTKILELRQKFADYASEVLSS